MPDTPIYPPNCARCGLPLPTHTTATPYPQWVLVPGHSSGIIGDPFVSTHTIIHPECRTAEEVAMMDAERERVRSVEAELRSARVA